MAVQRPLRAAISPRRRRNSGLTAPVTLPVTLAEPVSGFATEVVRLGEPGDAPLHVVFVPGNPGIAGYYSNAIQQLSVRLNATAAIVGLRGHSAARLMRPTAVFDLKQQNEHVGAFLQAEAAALSPPSLASPRLIVIGHSIGAHIAAEAAMQCSVPSNALAAFIGLMPYLDNSGIEHNAELRSRVRLATSWLAPLITLVIAIIAQLLGLLPRRIGRWLLRSETARFDLPAKKLTEAVALSYRFVNNVMTLFQSEAKVLARPFPHDRLRAVFGTRRVGFLFINDSTDMWASGAAAERAVTEGSSVRYLPSTVPHAFSTRAETSALVMDQAASWCEEMLRSE
jgi:pimeloyl-ACP methyl ester carboxylesterase